MPALAGVPRSGQFLLALGVGSPLSPDLGQRGYARPDPRSSHRACSPCDGGRVAVLFTDDIQPLLTRSGAVAERNQ